MHPYLKDNYTPSTIHCLKKEERKLETYLIKCCGSFIWYGENLRWQRCYNNGTKKYAARWNKKTKSQTRIGNNQSSMTLPKLLPKRNDTQCKNGKVFENCQMSLVCCPFITKNIKITKNPPM